MPESWVNPQPGLSRRLLLVPLAWCLIATALTWHQPDQRQLFMSLALTLTIVIGSKPVKEG